MTKNVPKSFFRFDPESTRCQHFHKCSEQAFPADFIHHEPTTLFIGDGIIIEFFLHPLLLPSVVSLIKITTMDNQNANTPYQYSSLIDTTDRNAVKYWTSKWNVSPQQLVGAVKATGSNSLVVVKEYLDNRKFKKKRPRYIGQL